MNINYNIETWVCSLRKMCIVIITKNVLENARRDPSTKDIPKSIASKAAEMVSELNLPKLLNTDIVAIIRPVMEEMLRWYNRYGDVTRAILTPHGTVDMARSAKPIVESDQPVFQRFVTACEHCLEDDIFNLGKQVTSVMLREQFKTLANFWYDVYGGNFDVRIIGASLSQEQITKGWTFAGFHQKISAIKYFREKATLQSIQVILDRTWNFETKTTPELCYNCLHDKVFHGEWLEERKGTISSCLLILLIKWPFQHLFLESAVLLMRNLSQNDFWTVAENISMKLSADYKEYDYKGLFVSFWNLGLTSIKNKLLADSNMLTIRDLLENLVLVKDEFLFSLVYDQIVQMDQDFRDCNFILSCLCFRLVNVEANESIEFLMRLIRTKYRELFLKFQNVFNRKYDIHALPEILFHSGNGTYTVHKENDIFLYRYVKFMSKYCVLPDLE